MIRRKFGCFEGFGATCQVLLSALLIGAAARVFVGHSAGLLAAERRAALSCDLKSLSCADHLPIRIGDERERLVAAWLVMTKSWGPSWGKKKPETGLVKPPRCDTRASKGAAPLGGAEEQTARAISAYAQNTRLFSLQMVI
jgi:hypothetical protein